jgi:hypothetical protein
MTRPLARMTRPLARTTGPVVRTMGSTARAAGLVVRRPGPVTQSMRPLARWVGPAMRTIRPVGRRNRPVQRDGWLLPKMTGLQVRNVECRVRRVRPACRIWSAGACHRFSKRRPVGALQNFRCSAPASEGNCSRRSHGIAVTDARAHAAGRDDVKSVSMRMKNRRGRQFPRRSVFPLQAPDQLRSTISPEDSVPLALKPVERLMENVSPAPNMPPTSCAMTVAVPATPLMRQL